MLFPSNKRGDTERNFFVVDAAYIAVQLHVQSQDLIMQSWCVDDFVPECAEIVGGSVTQQPGRDCQVRPGWLSCASALRNLGQQQLANGAAQHIGCETAAK